MYIDLDVQTIKPPDEVIPVLHSKPSPSPHLVNNCLASTTSDLISAVALYAHPLDSPSQSMPP